MSTKKNFTTSWESIGEKKPSQFQTTPESLGSQNLNAVNKKSIHKL